MSAPTNTAEFLPMSNETRGHAISQRRERLGIFSGYQFQDASERVGDRVPRALLSKVERGKASTASFSRIERVLDLLEEEMGQDPSAVEQDDPDEAPRTMEVRVRDASGAELVIMTPVADAPELEGMVMRLIREMRDPNA